MDSSYTPHEHEELKSLVRKRREQLRRGLSAATETRTPSPQQKT